jgi:hypothetical protein
MGIPFLFADRFSGAVVHLTTDGVTLPPLLQKQQSAKTKNARDRYLAQAFRD